MQTDRFYDIAQSLPTIAKYLTLEEKLRLHNSSNTLRQLTSNSSFWPTLELNTSAIAPENIGCYLNWFFKSARKFGPQKITIFLYQICEQLSQKLVNMMMEGPMESVTILDLYCESDDVHLGCSLCFPALEELTIRSKCATNQLVECMATNLGALCALIVIKNDIEFTCLNLSKYIRNPMRKLVVKPYLVQFDELEQVTNKSCNAMQQLELDVQQCSQSTITKIIHPLLQLQILRLYHLQNLQTDTSLTSLLTQQTKISQLALTKVSNFPLSRILKVVSSKNLLRLDISQSKYANDQDMLMIARECPNLRDINVAWCNGVGSQGLRGIVDGCLEIEVVNFTGVKESRDWIFPEYCQLIPIFNQPKYTKTKNQATHNPSLKQESQLYQDEYFFLSNPQRHKIKTLRKLRILQCHSCNVVSDSVLKIIYLINRRARTYNYYGNYMGLFPNQSQEAFC